MAIISLAGAAGMMALAIAARFSLRLRFGVLPVLYAKAFGDLAGNPLTLSCDGVTGRPDIVFRNRITGRYIVGEYKSFPLKGAKREAAILQALLYAGMLNRSEKGVCTEIRVLCGRRLVMRRYNEKHYLRVVAKIPELRRAKIAKRSPR